MLYAVAVHIKDARSNQQKNNYDNMLHDPIEQHYRADIFGRVMGGKPIPRIE
jgi:hypothetical protein